MCWIRTWVGGTLQYFRCPLFRCRSAGKVRKEKHWVTMVTPSWVLAAYRALSCTLRSTVFSNPHKRLVGQGLSLALFYREEIEAES